MSVSGGLDLADSHVAGPAELIGGPPFLVGDISIRSDTASARSLASARMRPALVLGIAEAEREFVGPVVAYWPGRQHRVRVKIEIGTDVAPGHYRGVLKLGGLEVPSEVYVAE